MKQAMRVVHIIKTAGVRNAVGIIVLLALSALAVEAQSSLTDGHTPVGMASGAPAGSYPLSGFDNVNLFNGKLNLQLPLVHMGGRGGAHAAATLPIESQWHITVQPTCSGCHPIEYAYNAPWYSALLGYGPGFMEGRYSVSDEQLNCGPNINAELPAYTLSRITFVTSDGTEFELRDQQTDGRPALVPVSGCTNTIQGFSRGRVFRTADGTAATFISDTDIVDSLSWLSGNTLRFYPSGTLILRDGTRYSISSGLIKRITDRNGNMVSFTYANEDNPIAAHPLIKITDSLNRTVDISYADSSHNDDRITFRGANGVSRTIHVWYSAMDQVLRPGFSITTVHNLFPELNNDDNTPYNPRVVSAVELPDTRRYQFKYNQYGEAARLELPTGGAIEYDYPQGPGNDGAVSDRNGIYVMIYRPLLERRVYPDSSGTSSWIERTTYTLFSVAPNTVPVVSHYGPNGSTGTLLASERHYFTGFPLQALDESPIHYSAWDSGKEYQTEAYNENGTLLRRGTQAWHQRAAMSWSVPINVPGEPSNDPRITDTTTTLEPGGPNLMSKQSIGYDDLVPYNNPNDVNEFDYGNGMPGALVRETRTTFITSSNYTDATTGVHLRSLPSQVSTFDAGGIERSRTTFEYDNYAAADSYHATIVAYPRPGFNELPISGLDPAFNSASSNLTRGNATATTHYLLNNSGSVTGSISNYAQYDIAGNVVKTIDGRGYATTFDFADRFGIPDADARANAGSYELNNAGQYSYAFPTLVTNALEQTAYTQFDFYLGRLVDAEDANGVVSSAYSEYDPLDRPTKVIRAANQTTSIRSQTIFAYDDANHLITTTSDQVSFNDPNPLRTQTVYDGLGRTIESRTYENSTQYIAVQQVPFVLQPDPDTGALVAAAQSSNPFRPYLGEQPIWTTIFSDALGRVSKTRTPDNAIVRTLYSGNTVTVTDQANKSRKSVMDSLGRLIQVYEAPNDSNYNYLTSYVYDALDDLRLVTQGTQPARSFVYDSLKRLSSATNPESGTNNYTYDANSNLLTKQDARGVKTTFDYDALNRVISRTYTSDPQNTPAVVYKYDAQTLPPGWPSAFNRGFSTGRLVSVTYGVTSAGNYTGYDQLGRVTTSYQQTDNLNYGFSYGYNLAGGMTSETYPSGRQVLTEFDSAGRAAGVKAGALYYAGASPTDTVNRIQYAAHGAISAMKLGNGKWELTSFNTRLQPTLIGLGTSSADSSILRLDYGYGNTNNNGNVLTQTISVPALTLNQCYGYDSLNRLSTAEERSGGTNCSGTQQWKHAFIYDRYGNRNFDVANTTSNVLGPNPTIDQATNRFTEGQNYRYDFAGNLTSDPTTPPDGIVYDAENRQTQYTKTGQPINSYFYDGEGRRVKKIDNTGTTVFVYNAGGQLIAEYTSGNPSGGGTSYLTSDHLGSTRVVTDSIGGVKARYDYLPFGEQIPSTIGGRSSVTGYVTTDMTRQKFTQKERDNESGLDYFLARYYSSAQGRFTGPDEFAGGPDEFWALGSEDSEKQALPYCDAANPQSLNKYQYAFNNPVRYIDPDGHQSGKDTLTKLLEFIGLYTPTPTPNGARQAILNQRIPGQDGMTVGDANQIMLKATEQLGKNLETVLSVLDPSGTVGAMASMAKGDTQGTALAAVGALAPGLRSERLFSGAASRLGTALSKAVGLEVTVTTHTVSRFISRALTEGGELSGVSIKQVAKTLQHGEVFYDKVNNSYVALRKGVAIAFRTSKGKVVVRTIERGTNVKAGERFIPTQRPF